MRSTAVNRRFYPSPEDEDAGAYCPSPEEIAAQTAAFREGWSEQTLRTRSGQGPARAPLREISFQELFSAVRDSRATGS